jgi:hypothetical protein
MCSQAAVIDIRMIFETLNPLFANRAWNPMLIHTPNRKRVDCP